MSALPLSVLFVDDQPDQADYAAQVVSLALNVSTSTAYDGLSAIDIALTRRPDVMVIDLHMPGLSGIKVAQAVRQRLADAAPCLIGVTGSTDAAREVAGLDGPFDQVFAKPLDIDRLIAALTSPSERRARQDGGLQRVDLGELTTRTIRQVAPVALQRGVGLSFDFTGPSPLVLEDPVQFQCGLHRLVLGMLDLVVDGHVIARARARKHGAQGLSVTLTLGGAGTLLPMAEIERRLARLGMQREASGHRGVGGVFHASGVCRNTHAPLHCWLDSHEGLVVTARYVHPEAVVDSDAQALHVNHARAWVVDANRVHLPVDERRLQRWGWLVARLPSCQSALASLRAAGSTAGGPISLLVVVESDTETAADREALQHAVPPQVHCVLAVLAGSALQSHAGPEGGYEMKVLPI